jgi:hypothetical protein
MDAEQPRHYIRAVRFIQEDAAAKEKSVDGVFKKFSLSGILFDADQNT